MENLKKLFGDKALTYAELEAALKDSKEVKLANLAAGQYVDKGKLDTATTAIADLKGQLAQRDTDLAELKKLDAAGLQQKVTDLQSKYDADTKSLAEKLTSQTLDSKIDLALVGAKAKNPIAAKALLKMDAIKLDGENVLGLKEQLESITKENPYLFGEAEQNPPPPSGGNPAPVDDMAKWRAEAGLPPMKE